MLPINVTIQFVRDGNKETQRVQLMLNATVREVLDHLLEVLKLPVKTDGLVYQLLHNRQILPHAMKLFEIGIQENAILQLVAADPQATSAGIPINLLARMGAKSGSSEPLPIPAAFFTRDGTPFVLKHTRAMIGRADPERGITADSLDADLSPLDPNRSVSRPHALVVYSDKTFTIRDLYSQHGVVVNGVRVPTNTAYPLHNGDWVILGEVELQFRAG
ncbi:MAG: hypothetical protein OHK0023_15650 [Anaerolineae bacterium]